MNIRIFRSRHLAALSLTLVAAGCGMFSESPPRATVPTEPSTASVVLYHVHLGTDDDDFTDHNVYLNGTRVGRLNAGEELRLQAAPGVNQLNIIPEMRWLGSTRQDPLKYSIELTHGSTRYLRYRTASGEGRILPTTGTILADRELSPVTEQEYTARN
jgi:hypothetical protein